MDPDSFSQRMPPGVYPFWFWNDRLSAGEIRWQIGQMAAQGARGFYVHPRQGLEQPYLSDAFFAMLEAAVEAAAENGMSVHLYDEYPYPSGAAGGETVLGRPAFHATELRQVTHDVEGAFRLELPEGQVLAARAYRLAGDVVDWSSRVDLRPAVGMHLSTGSYMETGLTQYNRKRYFASHPVPVLEGELPEGRWRVFASVQGEVRDHKYWGSFLDALNPEAVQAYIGLTHERYWQRLGRHFGKTILSIFTDETHPGWSARVPEAFRSAYGYDLLEHLEALQDERCPEHWQVRSDLNRLLYEMFVDSYDRPISEWCRAHGIAYAGEKPSLRLGQLRYMDIPGCEPAHTKAGGPVNPEWANTPLDVLQARIRGNARATASAAYFYGKAGPLDECFHSLGWSGTLQDAKLMTDAMLLCGIRYLVPHGFFYSTHGLRKHDAPPTFFYQAPYWPFFGQLVQHFEQAWKAFEGTHIAAEVLVVEPAFGLPQHEDLLAYQRIQGMLMAHQVDYLHADTDILAAGQVQDGALRIRDITARVVIVPPMPVVEEALARWLDGFEQAGGCVLRCGRDFDERDALEAIEARVEPRARFRAEAGSAERLWAVRRVSAEKELWFLINTGAERLELRIDTALALREITGAAELAGLAREEGGYRRALAPFESCLLEQAPAAEELPAAVNMPAAADRFAVELDGPARVRPLQANLLRLGAWELALVGENGQTGERRTVEAVPLANQLARSGLAFAPEFVLRFGVEPEMKLPRLHARFRCAFENRYGGAVTLAMEPGSIAGEWSAAVNGTLRLSQGDFAPVEAHTRGSLGADISAALRQGSNEIVVDVVTDRLDGGLLNPLYLAGDFGVTLQPLGLAERPERGQFERHEANGLPFFAGTIEYTREVGLEGAREGQALALELRADASGGLHDALEISLNGSPFVPSLWEPRVAVIPAGHARPGSNTLTVRVYTTLVRAFEGCRFDYQAHGYRAVE